MITKKDKIKDPLVLIFDDECILCNGFVSFVIKNDSKGKFKFAGINSDYAQKQLKQNKILNSEADLQSSYFIERGQIYSKSTGILRALKYLDGRWKYFSYLSLVPRMIRDFFYDRVAFSRYLLGRNETCLIPSPEIKSRFF